MKQLILASTSTLHGGAPLQYLESELKVLFSNTKEILFIPYARPGGINYDDYTKYISKAFKDIGKQVKGIHEFNNPKLAIKQASAIYVGGGNTFVLVNQLYKNNCIEILKEVIEQGTPYLGTSAGSNIAGVSMQTTNDMPIVYPPSFKTLGVVPFNINPHYLDPDINSTFMGETRETRLKEFHAFNDEPVVGLREGSWITVKNEDIKLNGKLSARVFLKDNEAVELSTNNSLKYFTEL